MHIDPIDDADDYLTKLDAENEASRQHEAMLYEMFMRACKKTDANALASFAPMVADWQAAKVNAYVQGRNLPKRLQTLTEVMSDALDVGNGPTTAELMQLVLNLAFSAESQAEQAQQARDLLSEMAKKWAEQNV